MLVCKICNIRIDGGLKKLSVHLQYVHKISSEEYSINYLYGGKRPKCNIPGCNVSVRYVSFSFKKYCKEHSNLAFVESGSIGGKRKTTWNKGKTKDTDERILQQSILVTGERNHFFGKYHTDESKIKMMKSKIISKDEFEVRLRQREKDFIFLSGYEDYISRQYSKLTLSCLVCNKTQEKTLQSLERGSLCQFCHPLSTTSKAELEIGNYIESLNFTIERNNRTIISPKEIDIYVPSVNLGIEYNGLFWHDAEKVGKTHHLNKSIAAKEKDIMLLHIFSDEWESKKDIVKSMISCKLGKLPTAINARSCEIRKVSSKESKEFFDENHIAGNTKSFSAFGLYTKNNVLVACMSFRKPNQKKEWFEKNPNVVELARYANKKFCNVRGGFSKLLNYSLTNFLGKEIPCEKLISYCDLRTGSGNVYEKCGFVLKKKNTGISFWYTDGERRLSRFSCRATNGKTEKENAESKGIWRVYGCGNSLYEYVL